MRLFHLRSAGELIFGSPTSATKLNLFFGYFLDGSRFFKEAAGIACQDFEAFSRGCILSELEMVCFLTITFELFFRVAEFAHLLRMFSCSYPHF